MLRSLQLLFLSLSFVEALDIILKDFECNETLPVAIQGDNLFLECNGSNQCTMGTDANISGKCKHHIGKRLLNNFFGFLLKLSFVCS